MRALLLDEELKLVDDYPTPEPPPGEALIRVNVAGVCNTDLELVKGYHQFRGVLGHEFVGVVERAPGAEAWEGRRVVGEINVACGAYPACRANRPSTSSGHRLETIRDSERVPEIKSSQPARLGLPNPSLLP